MTVYIIDSNLIFSAALSLEGGIAEFIASKENYDIRLLAPTYLQQEISRHFDKLVSRARLPDTQVQEIINYLYQQLEFVVDKDIPIPHYARAAELVREIDPDDLYFVALSSLTDEYLLTSDLKLYEGLMAKGYQKVITFQQLKEKHNIK